MRRRDRRWTSDARRSSGEPRCGLRRRATATERTSRPRRPALRPLPPRPRSAQPRRSRPPLRHDALIDLRGRLLGSGPGSRAAVAPRDRRLRLLRRQRGAPELGCETLARGPPLRRLGCRGGHPGLRKGRRHGAALRRARRHHVPGRRAPTDGRRRLRHGRAGGTCGPQLPKGGCAPHAGGGRGRLEGGGGRGRRIAHHLRLLRPRVPREGHAAAAPHRPARLVLGPRALEQRRPLLRLRPQ